MHATYRDAWCTVWLWLDTIIVSLLFVYRFEIYLENNVSCIIIAVIKYSMVSGTENIRNPFQTFRPFTTSTIYTLPLVLYTKSSWRISRAQVIRNTQRKEYEVKKQSVKQVKQVLDPFDNVCEDIKERISYK
jgi:hypothetical protein